MSMQTYDRAHAELRAALRPLVERGEAQCTEPVCLMSTRWIAPGATWDLAHDRATGGYRGPAHRRCNRAEGASYGNRLRGLIRHGFSPARRTVTAQPPAAPVVETPPSPTWSSRDWSGTRGRVESS